MINELVQPKISLGSLIRKCIMKLKSSFTELVLSNNSDVKEQFAFFIINNHRTLKVLKKFSKRVERVFDFDVQAELISYKISSYLLMCDDFFRRLDFFRFYKTPIYNIEKAVKILNLDRYEILGKSTLDMIVDSSLSQYLIRKKDLKEVYSFIRRFKDNIIIPRNDENQEINLDIEIMKDVVHTNLKNNLVLRKFFDKIKKEFLFYSGYYYSFQIGKFLSYEILLVSKDNNEFCYQISDIKLVFKELKFLKINKDQIFSIINNLNAHLNETLTFKYDTSKNNEIEMIVDEDNSKENEKIIQMEKVITELKTHLQNTIFPIFFSDIVNFITKYINNYYNLISQTSFDREEGSFLIKLNFKPKFHSFSIKFSKYIKGPDTYIKINYSHKISVNSNDILVYVNNFEEIISFNVINYINFELGISDSVDSFYSIQYDEINKRLNLYFPNFIDGEYVMKQNKIQFYFSNQILLFNLIIDNKGDLNYIDEFQNGIDTSELLQFINKILTWNEEEIEDNFTKLIDFYLLILNFFVKKIFNCFQKAVIEISEIKNNFLTLKFKIKMNDSQFSEGFKNYSVVEYLIKIDLSKQQIQNINANFIFVVNDVEKVFDKIKNSSLTFLNYNRKKLDYELINDLYKCSFNIKKQWMVNFEYILNILNLNSNIEISNDFETIKLKRAGIGEKDIFQLIKDDVSLYISSVEILMKKYLNFKIHFTNKIRQVIPNYSAKHNLYDNEFQLDYNSAANMINIGIISKFNSKTDFSFIKKFFHSFFQRLCLFVYRILKIYESPKFNSFLIENNIKPLLSPIGMEMKIPSSEGKRYFWIFLNLNLKNKLLSRAGILPQKNNNTSSYITSEYINCSFEDLDENRFVDNLKNLTYYMMVHEKLWTRYNPFYNCSMLFDYVARKDNNIYFMITRKYNEFHLINHNRISFIIEPQDDQSIKLYSTNYLGYEESQRLVDKIIKNFNPEHISQGNGIRGIILQIDGRSSSLIDNDLNKLIEILAKFKI